MAEVELDGFVLGKLSEEGAGDGGRVGFEALEGFLEAGEGGIEGDALGGEGAALDARDVAAGGEALSEACGLSWGG